MSRNKPKNQTLPIPTREEFHKFASNRLSQGDFSTACPSIGVQISKVSSAIGWTYNNERWKTND